ncbi:MAG: deoxycytidylate deaminase [Patescibacteria group bacterium]
MRTATTFWTPEPENRLISGGYNGAPSGHPACDEVGSDHLMVEGHCIRTNHGEENALLNCHNIDRLRGGTATILGTPCYLCARKLAGAHISKVEYIGNYKNAQGAEHIEELFRNGGVEHINIPLEELLRIIKKGFDFAKGPGGPLRSFSNLDLESLGI